MGNAREGKWGERTLEWGKREERERGCESDSGRERGKNERWEREKE